MNRSSNQVKPPTHMLFIVYAIHIVYYNLLLSMILKARSMFTNKYHNYLATIRARLIYSTNGGDNGDVKSHIETVKTVAVVVGALVIIFVMVFFVSGFLGIQLLSEINPSSYSPGSAQYNLSTAVVHGITGSINNLPTVEDVLFTVVIIAVIFLLVGIIFQKFNVKF